MSENDNTRRAILATLAAGGGSAVVGGGWWWYEKYRDSESGSENDGSPISDEPGARATPNPVPTESPGTPFPQESLPWETSSLTVSVQTTEDDMDADFYVRHVDEQLQNATAYWNNHISENEPFDMEITFDPEASNPDIRIQWLPSALIAGCRTKDYHPLVSREHKITPWTCVRSVTEPPEEPPVTAVIGRCGASPNVFELVAKHTIGRCLGYKVWSEPTKVMTAKNIVGAGRIGRALNPLYAKWEHSYTVRLRKDLPNKLEKFGHPTMDVKEILTINRDGLENIHKEIKTAVSGSRADERFEEENQPILIEAYNNVVLDGEDMVYMEQTISMLNEILDAGPPYTKNDEFSKIRDRIEIIIKFPQTQTPWDLRVHQYYLDKIWEKYA